MYADRGVAFCLEHNFLRLSTAGRKSNQIILIRSARSREATDRQKHGHKSTVDGETVKRRTQKSNHYRICVRTLRGAESTASLHRLNTVVKNKISDFTDC